MHLEPAVGSVPAVGPVSLAGLAVPRAGGFLVLEVLGGPGIFLKQNPGKYRCVECPVASEISESPCGMGEGREGCPKCLLSLGLALDTWLQAEPQFPDFSKGENNCTCLIGFCVAQPAQSSLPSLPGLEENSLLEQLSLQRLRRSGGLDLGGSLQPWH